MLRRVVIPVMVACLIASTGAAAARTRALRLPEAAALKITGAYKAGAAGDVNGDGTPDLLAAEGFRGTAPTEGRVHVVFGNPDVDEVNVDSRGDHGFTIHGALPGDIASEAAGAGDVNGDGLDDILVGAADAGKAYVVFGKTDTNPYYLATLEAGPIGVGGFRISGPGGGSLAGRKVSSVGDVNGDGLADLLIAAPFAGATYVVFGKTDTSPVDLRDFHTNQHGDQGYMIRTDVPDFDDGYDVAGLGDVNGDGIPDIGIGVFKEEASIDRCCLAYVVFGKSSPEPIVAKKVRKEKTGFRIFGGSLIAAAGDVNGDGLADIAVGRSIVFGKKGFRSVNLGNLGRGGYRVTVDAPVRSVSSVGDVNGDGLDDVALGCPDEDSAAEGSGSVYIVFGKRGTSDVDATDLGRKGFRIDGPALAYAGGSVAGPGDIDGDGLDDILIGAGGTHRTEGAAYLVGAEISGLIK